MGEKNSSKAPDQVSKKKWEWVGGVYACIHQGLSQERNLWWSQDWITPIPEISLGWSGVMLPLRPTVLGFLGNFQCSWWNPYGESWIQYLSCSKSLENPLFLIPIWAIVYQSIVESMLLIVESIWFHVFFLMFLQSNSWQIHPHAFYIIRLILPELPNHCPQSLPCSAHGVQPRAPACWNGKIIINHINGSWSIAMPNDQRWPKGK